MNKRTHGLNQHEMELVKLIVADCHTTGDIQDRMKRLFAGTIEQMLEAEMDHHLGYEKNSPIGNNSGNSRNGYGQKLLPVIMVNAKLMFLVIEMVISNLKLLKNARFVLMKLSINFSYVCQRYVTARYRRYSA